MNMKQTLFSLLFACMLLSLAKAQVLRNTSGTTLTITSGTTVIVSGLNLQNDAGATINHSGNLVMAGNATGRDIINDGAFNGSATGATIRMTGTTEQLVSGSSVVNIYDFQVNNGGNGTSVSNTGALRIHNNLLLTNGDLFTADASPVRFTTTASNPTETNDNHIIGTAIMEARAVGTAAFPTFLRFSMAAGADVGNLTLTRRSGHGTATSRGFTPTQGYVVPIGFESIDAHWVVDVTNNASRDITISWFPAWDNGKDLTQMQLWRTNTPFTIGSPWVLKTVGTVDMSTRVHTDNATASELRNAWTVSDVVNPLPVELLSFDAKRKNENDVYLNWYAKNEINLARYELERSFDNARFELIHNTKAQNQAENSYDYVDVNAKGLGKDVLYYRLKQVSLDNTHKTTPSKAVYFRKSLIVGIYPNPYRDVLNVQISNPEKQEIELSVMDNLGKTYLQTKFSDSYIDFQPSTFLPQLANGTYILRLRTHTQTEFFKIVKQ